MTPATADAARAFLRGFQASLALGAGYLPIAFSFGLAAVQAGLSPALTIASSVFLYAGASQFLLIALLASGAGVLASVLTVTLMNARHVFYGRPLLGHFSADGQHLPAPLLAFGLTDEVFAAAISRLEGVPPPQREHWYLGLEVGAHAAWIGGTIIGALMSHSFTQPPLWLEQALAFILPGLFFALLLETGVRRWLGTIAATVVITGILLCVLPAPWQALTLGMVAGALCGAVQEARRR